MVGTKPMRMPSRRHRSDWRCMAATLVTTRIVEINQAAVCIGRPDESTICLRSTKEFQRRALRFFVRARFVDGRIRFAFICAHEVVRQQKSLNFLAAYVREHSAIDLDTRAE